MAENEKEYMEFGFFPQGPYGEIKPIEWQVIKKSDGRMLLLSKYGLEYVKYHDAEENVTWENSYLRRWLNKEFINTAFTAEEQSRILTTHLVNKDNISTGYADDTPFSWGRGGSDSDDKIFLFSIDEAKEFIGQFLCQDEYFDRYILEGLEVTEYAIEMGEEAEGWDKDTWWLRSPGKDNTRAACVSYDGKLNIWGENVCSANIVVRPSFWVSI